MRISNDAAWAVWVSRPSSSLEIAATASSACSANSSLPFPPAAIALQQPLVVAEPETEGGRGDPGAAGLRRYLPQLQRVGDAGVGVTVADQQDRAARSGAALVASCRPAQVTGGQVGRTTGDDLRDAVLRRGLVGQRNRGISTRTWVSKVTTPNRSAGSSRSTSSISAFLAPFSRSPDIEPLLSNTTTRVRGVAPPVRLGDRCGEFDEKRDLVVGFNGDDVEVQLGADVHGVPPEGIEQVGYAASTYS